MFETVVPETFTRRSRRLLYETLPLSLALHGIAAAAYITSAIWSVAFPSQSPRVSLAYSLTDIPDPPPPPRVDPPKPQPAAPQHAAKAAPPPLPPALRFLAPTKIPDLIPHVAEADASPAPPPPPEPVINPTPATDKEGGPREGGALGGQLGGSLHGVQGGIVFAEDGRVHVDRSLKLPLKVIDQVFPSYPEAARKGRMEGEVIIRYIIATNGRVREWEVISPADKMFEEAAIDAIRQWRFRPMMHDGKAVEVVHEVAVAFEFIAR